MLLSLRIRKQSGVRNNKSVPEIARESPVLCSGNRRKTSSGNGVREGSATVFLRSTEGALCGAGKAMPEQAAAQFCEQTDQTEKENETTLYPGQKRNRSYSLGRLRRRAGFYEILSDSCTPINIFHSLKQDEEKCAWYWKVWIIRSNGGALFLYRNPSKKWRSGSKTAGRSRVREKRNGRLRIKKSDPVFCRASWTAIKSPSFPKQAEK